MRNRKYADYESVFERNDAHSDDSKKCTEKNLSRYT